MEKKEEISIFQFIDKDGLDGFIDLILKEDLQDDLDVTTDAVFSGEPIICSSKIVSKDDGIIAGLEIVSYIMKRYSPSCQIDWQIPDGTTVRPGDKILEVKADMADLLKVERICLNLLGRLSGIATITSKFVDRMQGTKCGVLDTRKTTPGLRFAEKYAVKVGGGVNHRIGLFDVVMIKDNHVDAAGGIVECVKRVRDKWGAKYRIIVETRNMEEVSQAVSLGVDRILLDNMSCQLMSEIVKSNQSGIPFEASGNITLQNAREIALTGVDFISTSYITAWAQPLDLSLILSE